MGIDTRHIAMADAQGKIMFMEVGWRQWLFTVRFQLKVDSPISRMLMFTSNQAPAVLSSFRTLIQTQMKLIMDSHSIQVVQSMKGKRRLLPNGCVMEWMVIPPTMRSTH